jgi:hypothetical protein
MIRRLALSIFVLLLLSGASPVEVNLMGQAVPVGPGCPPLLDSRYPKGWKPGYSHEALDGMTSQRGLCGVDTRSARRSGSGLSWLLHVERIPLSAIANGSRFR